MVDRAWVVQWLRDEHAMSGILIRGYRDDDTLDGLIDHHLGRRSLAIDLLMAMVVAMAMANGVRYGNDDDWSDWVI